MTIEARHLNFCPQLIFNRETMNPIETNINMYNTQMGYSSLLPSSGTTTTATATTTGTETLLFPAAFNDSLLSQKTIYNNNTPHMSRKRSRDYSTTINPYSSSSSSSPPTQQFHKSNCISSFSFMGQDISFQIQQQQLDIHHSISQHMEKMRMEVEEKRKNQARRLVEAIEQSVSKRMKAKEEEIEKIGKMNWALEEKVKSLCIENQLWRELAQSNEATANALRTNLEQVLANGVAGEDMGDTFSPPNGLPPMMDDAQSCCDSNECDEKNEIMSNKRLCRGCGKEESCVLILPCRHLCLCGFCGSNVNTCPVCKSHKTGSIHVNLL